jgi:regulatory protein RepA
MTIQSLDIRRVLGSPPPELDFVLPGLLAGTVGMIVGPGAVGKTTFLLQLAMSLSAGGSLGCGLPFKTEAPGKVVFVAAEETASLLSHRLHAVHRYVLDELGASFLDGLTPAMRETPRIT